MKNKLSIVLILTVFVALVLGCGISDKIQKAVEGDSKSTKSSDDKSVTDKAIDAVADGESTGVPECDEVFVIIDEQTNSKDDNVATRFFKGYVLGKFKTAIKESVEKNKEDKTKMAKECSDIKKQIVKAIEEQKAKEKE
jgi:hypothetical protein